MPVLATAHYYSRYEFEVSQRVPKVIMGRHQQRPMLLVAPDVPCEKNDDDDGEHGHSPSHCMPQRALSPLQGPNLCTRVFFWVSWDTGNKADGRWLLSPLLSLASPAPATL